MLQNFRNNLDRNLSTLLKLLGVVAIVLFIGYFGISIYANVTENRGEVAPEAPAISKAHYVLTVKNTLEEIFTDNVSVFQSPENPDLALFKIYNYWEVRNGVYKLFKHELVLDEYYWGDISMEVRK